MDKPLIEVVRIGKGGAVMLSRRVRSAAGLQEGEELLLTLDEHRIVLERRSRGLSTYLDVMNAAGADGKK